MCYCLKVNIIPQWLLLDIIILFNHIMRDYIKNNFYYVINSMVEIIILFEIQALIDIISN